MKPGISNFNTAVKYIVIFLLAAGALTACQKSADGPSSTEVTGQLKYGGDPAADGLGYYILVDSTHENLCIQNPPAEFRHADVNAHVAIKFFDTGKTQNVMLAGATGPRIVVLLQI